MKKIIVAIDGLNYKKDTIEFAITMANHLNGHLVGLFLSDRTYHSYKIYTLDSGNIMTDEEIKKAEAGDIELRQEAVQNFEMACNLHHIPFSVRENRNIALPELIHESIYADLLIIHSGEQFTHYIENKPPGFVRNMLEMVKCPVILAPDEFRTIKKALLLYDGSPESMYAIKSFCFLSDAFKKNLDVEVLSVKGQSESLHLPDNKLMKEYLKRHYPKAIYTVCKGEADKKIPAVLKKESAGTLVVSGAYNRGFISRWFRPSMADILLSMVKLPLFINHIGK